MYARIGAAWVGRVCRHRDRTRVQAPEERGHVVETRWDEQDDAISGLGVFAQSAGNIEGATAQLAEGEPSLFVSVSTEKPEDDVVRLASRAVLEQVDQSRDSFLACVVVQWFVGAHACGSWDGSADRDVRACIQPARRYQRYVSRTPCCRVTDARQPSSPLTRAGSQIHQRGRASLVL